MKILDKYILKSFIIIMTIILLFLMVLLVVVRFVDDLDDFTQYQVSAAVIIEYLIYYIPTVFEHLIPITILLSVLLLLLKFNIHRELIAIETGGISRKRPMQVILLFSIFISILFWLINETIVPKSIQNFKSVRLNKIEQRPARGFISESQTWLRGPRGEFYSIGLVGDRAHYIHDIELIKFNPAGNRILSNIYIQSAKWNDNSSKWLAANYRERFYDKEQNLIQENYHPEIYIDLSFEPDDFVQLVQIPEEMNSQQLRYHIELLSQGGLDIRESLTIYHQRYSGIITPVIFAILGLGYGFAFYRVQIISGIAHAILLAILYSVISQFGFTLGQTGFLPPFWSAWLANITIGGWAIYRIQKSIYS